MSQQQNSVDDVLLEFVQNVHRVSSKAADLARMQHEHTIFLRNIAARIGQARRSMQFCQDGSR